MADIITPAGKGFILYMTDRYGVSQGYEPAFTKLLNLNGIRRQSVILGSIYNLVDEPLAPYKNTKLLRFNPEKLKEIQAAFDQRIAAIKPKLIVVADPAVLGVIVGGDRGVATLEKTRGGVYEYRGIKVIVTYPITVIHQRVDEVLLKDAEGEDIAEQPYRVPLGSWILNRDWQKIGRYYAGTERKLQKFVYSVCHKIQDVVAAKNFLSQCVAISTDIETGCFPPQITCVGYTGLHKSGVIRSFVIPFYDPTQDNGCYWDSIEDHMLAMQIVADINALPILKIMQNGLYDCSYFIRDRIPPIKFYLDTMAAWWSMYMELPKTLDFISSILLDNYQYWKDDIKGIDNKDLTSQGMETYWRYCALDCYNTLYNGIYLSQVINSSPGTANVYWDAMRRIYAGLGMSMRGVKANFARRDEHEAALIAERDEHVQRLRYIIDDPEFNINSPAQKVSLLYDVLGAQPRNARGRVITAGAKGPNASPSAGALPLKLIKTEHPVFRRVIEVMEAGMEPDKQISNVCKMFLATSRFRTSFNGVGTETTRFSSKKSNFWDGGNAQNIRKKFRDWMVADDGCILMEIDYSQSDDVFVGFEANDPDKIEVFRSGKDAHAVNGELFFKVGYDVIVDGKKAGDPKIVHPVRGIRQISKRVVHGTNFQMMAMTLYITMGREAVVAAAHLLGHADAHTWNQERLVSLCEILMATYRRKYRRISKREWYAEIAKQLETSGTVTNAFGITRRFMGEAKDSGTQREATAFIGQSDTAGNMNRTMDEVVHGYIPRRFRDGPNPAFGEDALKMDWESHGFQFLLQVHDSFLIQLNTRHPKWMEAASNILRVMERPIIVNGHQFHVPTEAEFGLTWGKGFIEWKDRSFDSLERIASTLRDKRNKA